MPESLYEHLAWQKIPGQVMRPGGLAITERALASCDLGPGSLVLDVGCGAGATLRYLKEKTGCDPLGADISGKLLKRARHQTPEGPLLQARSEFLPLASESMDAVITECALSLFETGAALREFSRVLRKPGTLIVSDIYARDEKGIPALRQLGFDSCIRAAMSRDQIAGEAEQHGFKIETWEDCSEQLKNFPVCTLADAASTDPFELFLAAARAKLGYYFLVARKG